MIGAFIFWHAIILGFLNNGQSISTSWRSEFLPACWLSRIDVSISSPFWLTKTCRSLKKGNFEIKKKFKTNGRNMILTITDSL